MSASYAYEAVPCNCGHPSCKHWHVSCVADVHGVGFDEEQARAVAGLLNEMYAERHRAAAHTPILFALTDDEAEYLLRPAAGAIDSSWLADPEDDDNGC